MTEDKLLEVLASRRTRSDDEPAGSWPHAEGLSFARARALALDPSACSAEERAHLQSCRLCAGLVKAFERVLSPAPTSPTSEPVAPDRPTRQFPFAPFAPTAAAAGVVLVPALNWLLAGQMISPSLSDQSWWREAQYRFLQLDAGSIGVLALLAPALHLLGWLGKAQLRLSFPLLLLGLFLVSGGIWLYADEQQRRINRGLNATLIGHRWVCYDPPGYDPYPDSARMPTEEEIEEDLRRLFVEGGFDGLITFSANGTLAEIPRLSRKVGFKAVIMGVSISRADPVKPAEQLEAAKVARDYVDAYCLGHNPPMTLDFKVLAGWMDELRSATKRPVTTTAPLVSYVGPRGQALRGIGDFYFPDCVGSWHLGANPKEIVEQTRLMVRQVAELPGNKPVLMKMISFPSAGGPGLSEEAQAEFFRAVCRDLYLPVGVSVSFYSAYDLPWMDAAKRPEWAGPNQHVGLFTAGRKPKPALDIVRRGFPVQSRH